MLRHPISPKSTNRQSSPSNSIRGSHAQSTNNDDTDSTSSISSEEEVLFDLDERAMSQLPRHLQHTMREIQRERLNRLHSQKERVVHIDTSRGLRRSQRGSHPRQQQQNQQKQQWLSNVVTRLQTPRPTVIPDGGFGALTSREKREVAPWVEEEEEQGFTSRADKKSPEVVVGLDSEAESDSGLGSNSLGLVGGGLKKRQHGHAAAQDTARACSPRLRRPRRRDHRPPRPPRYHHKTGECTRAGQGMERHSQGWLRTRASLMLSSVGGSVRKRMGRMSGFFAKM
ncbi:hypothetical protein PHISP_04487 [Aspergillus sp. HF37]|nr:hypothetical protein PHISP_04487 [Aspergillus sp. HF37]